MSSRIRVCVVGRSSFETGIGAVSLAAITLFSRFAQVELYDKTDPDATAPVLSADGRRINRTWTMAGYDVVFHADVLWNGTGDYLYQHFPTTGLRIAHVAWDSDDLPREWVEILNTQFDVTLTMSASMEKLFRSCGVETVVDHLSVGLPIEELLATDFSRNDPNIVRFGTITAFHERKGLKFLVRAFHSAFGSDPAVELRIHSNLSFGAEYEEISQLIRELGLTNVALSVGNIDEIEKRRLLNSLDAFVSFSQGEGYSIGPREALALGKPLVLSRLLVHEELLNSPGTFGVASIGKTPAIFPEIDGRVIGKQELFDLEDATHALAACREFIMSPNCAATALERKRAASRYSLTAMERAYRTLIDANAPAPQWDQAAEISKVSYQLPQRPSNFCKKRGIVVAPAQDGGFFSIFNAYASWLAWEDVGSSPRMVVADWNAARLRLQPGTEKPISYCYSRPEDGNLWNHLFQPPYDLDEADLADVEFLYSGDSISRDYYNSLREPLLTHVNAYRLYKAKWFGEFRSMYNASVRRNVRLKPQLQSEIDAFQQRIDGRFMVAAHIKHPSHAVEQPGSEIASRFTYRDRILKLLNERGIHKESDDWRLFIGTDQARVVEFLRDEFGDRLLRFDDVTRVDSATDEAFDSLDDDQKLEDGHQLQHQLAERPELHNPRLAWEVWRDAEAMAMSNVFLHSVSNVATAVSFLNPDTQMQYLEP